MTETDISALREAMLTKGKSSLTAKEVVTIISELDRLNDAVKYLRIEVSASDAAFLEMKKQYSTQFDRCRELASKLDAELQRAEKLQEDLRSMDAPTDAVRNHNLKLWAAIERLNKAEAEIAVMEKHTRGVEEALIAATDEISALKPDVLVMPDGLHQDTKALLLVFASAMAVKMHKAEQKYGYSNSWMQHDWQGKCLVDFNHHITKGDPLDVANYCAFMHYHGWPTALKGDQVQVITCYSCRKVMTRDQHAEADGFCPHCNVEIELDEDDLFTAPQKPVVLPPVRTRDDYESRLDNGDIGPYNHGHLEGWNAAIEAAGGIVQYKGDENV